MTLTANTPLLKRKFFTLSEKDNFSNKELKKKNDIKNHLNSLIWENNTLKKEVRYAMLKIAKSFFEYLNVDIKIKDILFTGSLANYNWTNDSDIDIHIILDLKDNNFKKFIAEYVSAKKDLWYEKHNIKIKKFKVEVFAKPEELLTKNKAVFSLIKNKWIQEPSSKTLNINKEYVENSIRKIKKEIDEALTIKELKNIKDKITNLRNYGLERDGEYSEENLIFKKLRNDGYIEKINKLKDKILDKTLTLNESKKGKSIDDKYEYGCLMLEFQIKNWNKITSVIKKEDVYDEPGFGIENSPHVTILYGFINERTNPDDVKKFVEDFVGNNKISIKLIDMSIFESDKFDVLKFGIESEGLVKLNKALSKNFEYTSDFPEYVPHMTISYLLRGKGDKYKKNIKKEIVLKSNKFFYSYPPNKELHFSTKSKENILGIEKGIEKMTDEKIKIIKDFINFTVNRLEIENPVEIYLHKGRDEYITTTASYVPKENSNHIRCNNRSIVDILRSIAHELTHNRQREIKSFNVGENVQTIGGWIEDEANAKAGILIKDFAMNYGFDKIYDI